MIKYADIIYLDFSKAFDTLSHYCLLVKMKNLEISKKDSKYCMDKGGTQTKGQES